MQGRALPAWMGIRPAVDAVQIKGAAGMVEAVAILSVVVLLLGGIAYVAWSLAPTSDRQRVATEVPQRQRLGPFVRRHPVFGYFVLAYVLSWLTWLPLGLGQNGLGLLPFRLPPALLAGGALGPIGSALLLTGITTGRPGLRHLLRRFVIWRVGVGWYAIALFGFPLLLGIGLLMTVPDAGTVLRLGALPTTLVRYVGPFISQILISGLAEEPGWRGFALPRLQQGYGALWATAILGLCWGCWHAPLFLMPGYGGSGAGLVGIGIPFGEFLVTAMAATVLFTWVFNHTRGSLLIAVMMHASYDSFPLIGLFPGIDLAAHRQVAAAAGIGVVACVVLALSRGRLGYRWRQADTDEEGKGTVGGEYASSRS